MPVTTTLSDSDLLRRVQLELDWNPRVEAIDVVAKVKNGVVTLTGFVDTYAKKVSMLEAIHRNARASDRVRFATDRRVRSPQRRR